MLTIILVLSIIIAGASFIYAIVTLKTEEKFTEFYLLNTERGVNNYPKNITTNEKSSVIIGLINHEYQTINYTIEIWLINQTVQENKTSINHAWYIDKISVMLSHTSNEEGSWKPQWEKNYTFSIDKKGQFELVFLLFTTPTDTYSQNDDYINIIENKINNAYREIHLFISVI